MLTFRVMDSDDFLSNFFWNANDRGCKKHYILCLATESVLFNSRIVSISQCAMNYCAACPELALSCTHDSASTREREIMTHWERSLFWWKGRKRKGGQMNRWSAGACKHLTQYRNRQQFVCTWGPLRPALEKLMDQGSWLRGEPGLQAIRSSYKWDPAKCFFHMRFFTSLILRPACRRPCSSQSGYASAWCCFLFHPGLFFCYTVQWCYDLWLCLMEGSRVYLCC